MPHRRAINAYVSDEAREAWRSFAGRHGVTVSALIQAIGELLGDESGWFAQAPMHDRVVVRAREIAAERLRRDQPRRKWYED